MLKLKIIAEDAIRKLGEISIRIVNYRERGHLRWFEFGTKKRSNL